MRLPHLENEEEKKLWKTMDDGKNNGVVFFDNGCLVNEHLKSNSKI